MDFSSWVNSSGYHVSKYRNNPYECQYLSSILFYLLNKLTIQELHNTKQQNLISSKRLVSIKNPVHQLSFGWIHLHTFGFLLKPANRSLNAFTKFHGCMKPGNKPFNF